MGWWNWSYKSIQQYAGVVEEVGIVEGDYNTWTKKWLNAVPNGLNGLNELDAFIDEKNEKLNIAWNNENTYTNFGIYNLSDFSTVFESSSGSHYTEYYPYTQYKSNFQEGMVHLIAGGVSHAIETYILLLRNDSDTIEVWRGGASALWSANTQTDSGVSGSKCYHGGISRSGKYILVLLKKGFIPYTRYLMLYEGSSV